MDAGVAEYWFVDPERASITVVRPGRLDHVAPDALTWTPAEVSAPLTIQLQKVLS